MQSHSNCAMLRGQRSFVGNQNESRDYTDCGCWWFVLVCWFIKAFTLSESCSGRSFPGLRIYMLSSTCIILTYFRFVFPQPQNNEQTVSHSRLISKQDHKALKQKNVLNIWSRYVTVHYLTRYVYLTSLYWFDRFVFKSVHPFWDSKVCEGVTWII